MTGAAAFLTGAGGLAVEVLLVRALAPVLGAAPRTLGAVAAAFLLALALGTLATRRAATRAPSPARLFAALSVAAGILGAVAVLLGPTLAAAVAWPRSGLALDPFAFAAAFAVSLPPALLMGAAFPFAIAAATSEAAPDVRAARAARLYGWNTLGGVAGAFATPTLLLPALGVRGSAVAAGALEAAGGVLLALALARRAGGATTMAALPVRVRVLVAMAATSALALAAEMAFARLLALFLRNSVFTVATLLAGFLLGNAAGSLAASGIAARAARPLRLFGAALGLAGVACVGGLHATFALARAAASGARAAGPGFLGLDGAAAEIAFELSLAVPVVVLPAFFFGAALPCLLALALGPARDASRPAEPLASLLVASGFGSVVGSIAGAVVLVPLAGASRAALAVGLLAAALGAAALFRRDRLLAVAVLVVAGLGAIPVASRLRVHGAGPAGSLEIVAYEEGPAAAVAVVRERERGGALRLDVNGTFSQGGGDGLVLERRQGFLSGLLASEPVRRALVIGVGTGNTLSGLAGIPGIESIEAVEILPEIAAVLPLFAGTNRGVAADPRVALVLDDGRRVVRERASAGLDLVVGELFFPWEAGAGALYSREQFAAVRDALRPGGTFVQWLPLHQMGARVRASVVATFLDVFPDASLVLGAPGALSPIAALVARRDAPTVFSLDRLDAAFADGPLAADLAGHGLVDPLDVLALHVARGEELRPIASGAPKNTDDRPFVELTAPGDAASSRLGLENLEAALAVRAAAAPAPAEGARAIATRDALAARHAAYGKLAEGFLEENRAALDPRTAVAPDYAEMYRRREEAAHLAAFEIDPRGGLVRIVASERALSRLRARQWGEALSLLESMAAVEPEEPSWRSLAAVALMGLGEFAEAAASVKIALERRPSHAPDHALLGRALQAQGLAEEARRAFDEALRLDPTHAAARQGRAEIEAGKSGGENSPRR